MVDLRQIITDGAIYDVVKYVVLSVIVAAAGTALAQRISTKLKTYKELGPVFLLGFVAIFVVLFALGGKSQQPNFIGGIPTVTAGNLNNGHDTVLILSMSVINTGNAQSIVKNWNVQAALNGATYNGVFSEMPPAFTFNIGQDRGPDFPTSITYKSEDDLLAKGTSPIPPGGMLAGTLFVVFKNVDASIFKAGADITVTYEDFYSRKYAATKKMTAEFGPVAVIPGLHTVMACPLPKGQPLPFNSNEPLPYPLSDQKPKAN